MANNWAIVIGINQYKHLQSLEYAQRDARLVRDFLTKHAKFDQVYYFADGSSEIVLDGATINTEPTYRNLRHFFEVRFATPCLKSGDTVWVFFSGHGLQYANWDYLMPSDADPEAAEQSALAIDDIADHLKRSGASNLVLFLDACRTDEQKFGQGIGTDPQGVVTVYSSSFGETSSEVEALQQSAFSYALLEGLQLRDKQGSLSLAQLCQYLHDRVPQLNRRHGKPAQFPRVNADLPVPLDSISVPQAKRVKLKNDAFPLPSKRAMLRRTSSLAAAVPKVRPKTILAPATGAAVVVASGWGYGLIQERNQNSAPNALTGLNNAAIVADRRLILEQSKRQASNLSLRSASAMDAPPLAQATGADLSLRFPRNGIYYAASAVPSASQREIVSTNNRSCIKIVNQAASTADRQQVIVSSLAARANGIFIEATQEQLKIGRSYNEFADSKGKWQWLEANADSSGPLAQCLNSRTRYVNIQTRRPS